MSHAQYDGHYNRSDPGCSTDQWHNYVSSEFPFTNWDNLWLILLSVDFQKSKRVFPSIPPRWQIVPSDFWSEGACDQSRVHISYILGLAHDKAENKTDDGLRGQATLVHPVHDIWTDPLCPVRALDMFEHPGQACAERRWLDRSCPVDMKIPKLLF